MNTFEPLDTSFIVKATICSILPSATSQDHTVVNRTHGCYFVRHPKQGQPYALSYVAHKVDFADVGEYDAAKTKRTGVDNRKQFHFDAKQIADDICKQINDQGPGDGSSFFGVFVCAGEEPTQQELENAHQRLEDYFRQNVAAADAQWSSNPRHDLISGIAKRAARYLQLDPEDHEWMSNYQKTISCPSCGERVRPWVAICKSCNAILDPVKYAKQPYVNETSAETQRRGPGRPKKEHAPA